MIEPLIPENERERLKELDSYNILDTLPEEEYDDITKLASMICNTPISLISLIDNKRQWFKSHNGIDVTETPKEYAFCAHTINNPNEVLIVPDSRKDIRFHDNPLVVNDPSVIFYAGVPLVTSAGYALGSLCVIDHKPSSLNEEQLRSLKALSKQVITLCELRRSKQRLINNNQVLVKKNQALEQFALVAAHDIRSPLRNISSLIELFWGGHSRSLDEEGRELFKLIDYSANQLRLLIDGIVNYTISEKIFEEKKEEIKYNAFVIGLVKLLDPHGQVKLILPKKESTILVNKTALKQVLLNLISNGIKYNKNDQIIIEIGVTVSENFYTIYIKDNGVGIDKKSFQDIFRIFETVQVKDRQGNKGSGIGLATVKKLVEGLGGKITVKSKIDEGSTFTFTLAK